MNVQYIASGSADLIVGLSVGENEVAFTIPADLGIVGDEANARAKSGYISVAPASGVTINGKSDTIYRSTSEFGLRLVQFQANTWLVL